MATQTILIEEELEETKKKSIKKLWQFLARDIENTIDYIEDVEDPIPVEFVTMGKRIDLHPAREWLGRMPRLFNELQQLEDKMDEEDDIDIYD